MSDECSNGAAPHAGNTAPSSAPDTPVEQSTKKASDLSTSSHATTASTDTVAAAPVAQPGGDAPANGSFPSSVVPKAVSIEDIMHELQSYVSDRYELQRYLGSGSYAVVFSAIQKSTGNEVAIKCLRRPTKRGFDHNRLLRELSVMKHMSHPNILKAHDFFVSMEPKPSTDPSCYYLVTDMMGSDLHRVIQSKQDLSERHIKYFVFQLLLALEHLHAANVIHRDIKPSNLLVMANCHLKLADLGMTREFTADSPPPLADDAIDDNPLVHGKPGSYDEVTTYVVTRWYRAPELLMEDKAQNGAIDIWSAGCVAAELLLKEPLFPGSDHIHQLECVVNTIGTPTSLRNLGTGAARQFVASKGTIQSKLYDMLRPVCSDAFADLIQRMLQFHPEDRITAADSLQHPFLMEFYSRSPHVEHPPPFHLPLLPDDLARQHLVANASAQLQE